jgi:hypothetical protein
VRVLCGKSGGLRTFYLLILYFYLPLVMLFVVRIGLLGEELVTAVNVGHYAEAKRTRSNIK